MSLGGTAGTPVTSLPARVYVKSGTTGYILGVLNNSGGTVTPTYSTVEIPYGTATNVVVSYIVNNIAMTQTATLLIGSQPLLTNATGTNTTPTIASVALRQGTSTGNVTIDNVIVTTFAPTAVLGVSDVSNLNSNFVRNTMVNDEINFGAKSDVKVYNMNGQVVKSASVSANKNLNVSDLQNGMYIVTGMVEGTPVSQKILKK
ncbi:MAG: T9SS type A sorting domain-containing protein [Kaistella sp.]|nr:T9SS type A sorting domain-containing protein [Kaistella sp.]